LYFASRTENRVVFRVALGRPITGVLQVPGLVTIHARGGCRIRTIISNSTHFTTQRELHSHTRSPSRNCLQLVLVPLKWSFGILISQRNLSRTGDYYLKKPRGGGGGGFLELDRLIRPSIEHVQKANVVIVESQENESE